jgi:hypothetical protein
VAVLALVGCGESSAPNQSAATVAGAKSAAVLATNKIPRGEALAEVDGMRVTHSSYAHWRTVERALGAPASSAAHRALGFLITSDWVLAEAAARGVSVSAAEVHERLAKLEQQSFPEAGSLGRFLASSHETEADLRTRVKIELLESRIAAKATGNSGGSHRAQLLASFQQGFQRRWTSRTTCAPKYVIEDCSEYHGKPENLSAPIAAAHTAARPRASSTPSSSAAHAEAASGEVYSSPGAMSIGSPTFERNGAIPVKYTCDGANISPALEWTHVPAKAAALVLFVIDDTPTGPASGIRWVVGDIDPSSRGVAAGQVPAGGIVGADTQGHAGYGGICPAHGKTSTIEIELYALSKKIPLSPGFKPATAESEYGSGRLLLGSAAVDYAEYHRP